jgi:cytoskeletal protein CcmA (bactofilin family)
MWKRRTAVPNMRGGIGGFLDEGTEIEGKYACAGTVVLNGRIRGEISAKDTLILGATASVHASIRAGTLIVHGELVGNVAAAERVELKRGARVTGDIEAPVIVMEEGVLLEGQCHMAGIQGSSEATPASSNVVALAR